MNYLIVGHLQSEGVKMGSLSYLLHTVGILLLCCAVAANKEPLANAKYKDPKEPLGVPIKNLISHMTLEEKIGQMVQVERANASTQVIKNYFISKILDLQNKVKTYTNTQMLFRIMCV